MPLNFIIFNKNRHKIEPSKATHSRCRIGRHLFVTRRICLAGRVCTMDMWWFYAPVEHISARHPGIWSAKHCRPSAWQFCSEQGAELPNSAAILRRAGLARLNPWTTPHRIRWLWHGCVCATCALVSSLQGAAPKRLCAGTFSRRYCREQQCYGNSLENHVGSEAYFFASRRPRNSRGS